MSMQHIICSTEWVAIVGDAEVVGETVGPGGGHPGAGGLVKADGNVQLLNLRPQRVVMWVVP